MYDFLTQKQIEFYNLHRQLKSCLCGHFESCAICDGKDEKDMSILKIVNDLYSKCPKEFDFEEIEETIKFLNLPQYQKTILKK